MRALCYHGKGDMRIDTVPDPKIEDPRDIVLKVTACAICGSDLHIFDGVTEAFINSDPGAPASVDAMGKIIAFVHRQLDT